jgi:proteic killer suppression protein
LEIKYKNKNLKRICTNADIARRNYGELMAKKIHLRIDNITAADSVEMLVLGRIGRCHPLHGDRKGQYSMDLIHPYRLIFTRVDNKIQIVEVQEIVDYH